MKSPRILEGYRKSTFLFFMVLFALIIVILVLQHNGRWFGREWIAAQTSNPKEMIVIFGASSLVDPFQELSQVYEAGGERKVQFNFAGSQQLAQQIKSGAQADVYASANLKTMDELVEAGWIDPQSVRIFACNRLVVIYPKSNPAGLEKLADLARPGVKIILAAAEVPVGAYSLEFFSKAQQAAEFGSDYQQAVMKNVVSYETNVKAVVSKIRLGEGDAGIVYQSDLTGLANEVGILEIPEELNVIAQYPIGILTTGQNRDQAAEWIHFLLSEQGNTILQKYHFSPCK